jgi:hypothetical protein
MICVCIGLIYAAARISTTTERTTLPFRDYCGFGRIKARAVGIEHCGQIERIRHRKLLRPPGYNIRAVLDQSG